MWSVKIVVVALFCVFQCAISWSQPRKESIDRHIEYGMGLGAMNYTGDLSQRLHLKFSRPAACFFYRHNFANEISVLRFNVAFGQITADESKVNKTLQQSRQLEFTNNILELGVMYEYDFFDFRDLKSVFFMSPYLYGGIAATAIVGDQGMLSIPFGVGLKLKLSEKWNIGIEGGARKTFSDKLDGYANDMELSSSTNNDWYYYAGFTISRTVYDILCKDD